MTPGQVIDVDRLDVASGDKVELDKVLLISNDEGVTVGNPAIPGAKVVATSQGEHKGDKIIVLKFKNKVRFTKKQGHRQLYTRLAVDEIVKPGKS